MELLASTSDNMGHCSSIEMQCDSLYFSGDPGQQSILEQKAKRNPIPPPLIPIEKKIMSALSSNSTLSDQLTQYQYLEDKKSKKNKLESIRLNVENCIQNLIPSEISNQFIKKVELCLLVLIGESAMKEFGHPQRTAEQVRR